jgi:hypothetical protein
MLKGKQEVSVHRLFLFITIFGIFGMRINIWAVEFKTIYSYHDGLAVAATSEDEWVMINKKGDIEPVAKVGYFCTGSGSFSG